MRQVEITVVSPYHSVVDSTNIKIKQVNVPVVSPELAVPSQINYYPTTVSLPIFVYGRIPSQSYIPITTAMVGSAVEVSGRNVAYQG